MIISMLRDQSHV